MGRIEMTAGHAEAEAGCRTLKRGKAESARRRDAGLIRRNVWWVGVGVGVVTRDL